MQFLYQHKTADSMSKMASNDVLSAILHYKRNIDKISDPPERALKYEDRLLHCINKLYKLPVNVNHLQETGIGRTVNALRKIEGEKGLGDAAKALVAKWKTMVMLEDEAERRQREEIPSEGSTEEDIKKIALIREAEKSQTGKTDSLIKSSQKHNYENHKSKSNEENKSELNEEKSKSIESNKFKSSNENKKYKIDSSNNHKDKKRKYEHDKNSHQFKHNKKHCSDESEVEYDVEDNLTVERYSPDHISIKLSKNINNKHSEKSNHKESNNNVSQEASKHMKRKEHKSSSSNNSVHLISKNTGNNNLLSSSGHSNIEKNNYKRANSDDVNDDGGIDSQSGASFADALGPMVVKKSKKKNNQVASSAPSYTNPGYESTSTSVKRQTNKQVNIQYPSNKSEPLGSKVLATLPVPVPYYKPSPIYNLPPQEASRKRIQAEEDALNSIMSNKNQRTKVYSGVKGGLAYVPTLYEFCCRVLQQHIDALEYTGGIPYSLLKPVLDGANAAQLFQFEHFNPYIIEDTDHLWKFHVKKEFRSETRQELESWRDMYLRCLDEREEKYKAVTANIQKSIEKSAPVRKAKLAYIEVAKPPRNILRKQLKNGIVKPEASRLMGKNDPEAVKVSHPKPQITPSIKIKPKVAPLMQKTLKSIKMTRFKR